MMRMSALSRRATSRGTSEKGESGHPTLTRHEWIADGLMIRDLLDRVWGETEHERP
jgi:hypothetical protein